MIPPPRLGTSYNHSRARLSLKSAWPALPTASRLSRCPSIQGLRTSPAASPTVGSPVRWRTRCITAPAWPAQATVAPSAKPWECAVDVETIRKNLPDEAVLASPDYDHAAWFFGAGGKRHRWPGYMLGYELIGNWLRKSPPADASAWIDVPAQVVLVLGLEGLRASWRLLWTSITLALLEINEGGRGSALFISSWSALSRPSRNRRKAGWPGQARP
jgi:hypothetical protein